MKKQCKLWFCSSNHYAKGYCQKHYQAQLRHGSPLSPNQEDILRANSMISLARQIIGEAVKYEQDESFLMLMNTFLNNTSEDDPLESVLPNCEKCGEQLSLLTDGKTFVVRSCGCNNEPVDLSYLSDIEKFFSKETK